jgi:hypothetical protein
VRLALLCFVAGCTIGSSKPDPLRPRVVDPDPMPEAVLAKQDPGADTSKNPVLSRSEMRYSEPWDYTKGGCRSYYCSGGGDPSLLVVVVALALRRRRRR